MKGNFDCYETFRRRAKQTLKVVLYSVVQTKMTASIFRHYIFERLLVPIRTKKIRTLMNSGL